MTGAQSSPEALLRQGLQRQQAGDLAAAVECYAAVLARVPEHFDALQLLGVACAQKGDHARAEGLLVRAAALRPQDANVLANLGAVQRSLGRIEAAIDTYRAALRLDPDLVNAHYNLGIALRAAGRLDEAAEAFGRTVELAPGHVQAHAQRVAVLVLAGRAGNAVAAGRVAVAAAARSPVAWSCLGSALKAHAEYAEALACQQRAVALAPADATMHERLANTLLELGEPLQALASYDAAIACGPDDPLLHLRAGLALADLGRLADAEQRYDTAARLRPGDFEPVLRQLQLMPLVFADREEIARWRERFVAGVQALAERAEGDGSAGLAGARVEPPFALQFLDGDVRPLKEAWARIYRSAFAAYEPERNTGAPRVGFVVTRRHEASFLHGMGALLDRLRVPFEIAVFCDQGGAAAMRAGLHARDIAIVPIPQGIEAVAAAVRAARCDVLCWWEVGTDATNYFVPFLRPAPVQCTSWGVQVTTGIRAMEAYLSSRLVEAEGAQAHYGERLLLADGLLTFQRRREHTMRPQARARLGIDVSRHLYVCAQQVGKLHPDFDPLLAAILRRDPAGIVLLLRDAREHWNAAVRSRIARTMPDVAARVVVLPRQPETEYLDLVACADALLDAPHFAGVNSTYDAFALDRPVVHLPSPYQRGRYTAACYRRMGLDDLIVADTAAYVDLALALGAQPDFREATRERIRAASGVLFEDEQAVRETGRLLLSLVEQARR